MAKRRKKNREKIIPDDYFEADSFKIARFGKLVISQSHTDIDESNVAQLKRSEHLPIISAQIDQLVNDIAKQILQFSPEKLLRYAWWEFLAITVQTDDDSQRSHASRMIEYIQSVIVSNHPQDCYIEEINEEKWDKLSDDIRKLFTEDLLLYQICLTAKNSQSADFDRAQEEFRFRLETAWVLVRGKRYQIHEKKALLDILTPHSDVLGRLFGIDAFTLVEEVNKLLEKLTYGFQDTFKKLNNILGEIRNSDINMFYEKISKDQDLFKQVDETLGELFDFDLFDVEKVTKLPNNLCNMLAWSPGEEADFFMEGPFRGWPLKVWPTMKRPFIRLNERILCFDVFSLFDNFYRVIQRLICRQLEPHYQEEWNRRQNTVSEELPFIYFERLLPGSCIYRSVFYRWKTSSKHAEWCEADGLLIYDDHLFVIEVKANAFTYTSPAIDLPAHIKSLENLVKNPATQGNRFIDFLESAEEVSIADSRYNEVGRLSHANFRHVTVCAITLDVFTELAVRAQSFHEIGIDIGQRAVWSLSIDDLRVYADLFDNPLIFLHFVEQRMCAKFLNTNGELDHLGLYISHNNYSEYIANIAKLQMDSSVICNGYSGPIDEYYKSVAYNELPVLPKQNIPTRLAEIITFLAVSLKPGRSQLVSFLLDARSELRYEISQAIEQQIRDNISFGFTRPASTTYKEYAVTIFAWSVFSPRKATVAHKHTQSVMAAQGEKRRLLVELEYSAEASLMEVHWQYVNLDSFSYTESIDVQRAGLMLRQRRVTTARKQRKIRVNELCPCGSRKKYKRCCR